ncbi:hypothetical protein AURDEDRAFT_163683 [Auricularia subglabra TFB-10046 SS5]|nr:hypothetical protein AURDEDRAFT_163683 [Auricularia subglabra TFB-10046 SS5]
MSVRSVGPFRRLPSRFDHNFQDGRQMLSAFRGIRQLSPTDDGLLLGLPRLPPELIAAIFAYLAPSDLQRVAWVSLGFRDGAWHPGLFVHCWLHLDINTRVIQSFEAFDDLVGRAVRHCLRPRVAFSCDLPLHDLERDLPDVREQMAVLMSTIGSAMPYLVHLRIDVRDLFWAEVDQMLLVPAPRLRSLRLGQSNLSRKLNREMDARALLLFRVNWSNAPRRSTNAVYLPSALSAGGFILRAKCEREVRHPLRLHALERRAQFGATASCSSFGVLSLSVPFGQPKPSEPSLNEPTTE